MNDPQDDIPSDTKYAPLWGALFEAGTVVLAVVLGRLLSCPPFLMIHWSSTDFLWGVAATLPLLGLVIGSVHYSVGPLARLTRLVERLLLPMFRSANAIDLVVISMLAGLGEELLFRGVVQHQSALAIGGSAGPWVGLAAAALLFGLLHWISFAYAVLAAAIGLYLGCLWMFTGNLLVPIVTHALYDWAVLVYLLNRNRPPLPPDP